MENQENNAGFAKKFGDFHDRHYKSLLLLPVILVLFCLFYMFSFYSSHGDFIIKDFSLAGGTSITIQGKINADELKQALSGKLDEINTRIIYDVSTREQTALIVQTKTPAEDAKKITEGYLGYSLTSGNSSTEFINPALGENFYRQLLYSMLIAFLLMGIVVFIIFRTFIPSMAVIISAFADILMTLTAINLLGVKMSSAGIVAFLMLIGYSVDTDILLTNRVLKTYHDSTINQRILGAFKTGMTMTATSFLAVFFALIIVSSFSPVLSQIFTVLSIGLVFDVLNTWITNASIIKWYAIKNGN